MLYDLCRQLIGEVEQYEREQAGDNDLSAFVRWLSKKTFAGQDETDIPEPDWEGKSSGRSPESIINTLIVQLYRYAKTYAKAAIAGSAFSTIDDFIYVINLKFSGDMSKTALIEKNIHEKSTGMQIINRLLKKGMVVQKSDKNDKRSKVLSITPSGDATLMKSMDKIRKASLIVTGDLDRKEKMQLIEYLKKLEEYHAAIFASHRPVELDQIPGKELPGLN